VQVSRRGSHPRPLAQDHVRRFLRRFRSKLGKPKENKLGEGSEGAVYAVMEIETGALFAVKWLKVNDMREINVLEQMQRTAGINTWRVY
jgi:hypothetical protein